MRFLVTVPRWSSWWCLWITSTTYFDPLVWPADHVCSARPVLDLHVSHTCLPPHPHLTPLGVWSETGPGVTCEWSRCIIRVPPREGRLGRGRKGKFGQWQDKKKSRPDPQAAASWPPSQTWRAGLAGPGVHYSRLCHISATTGMLHTLHQPPSAY